MRLLYVVQRYGASIAGGAEEFTRQVATRLAARGHQVEVVTTCATSYVDWANQLPPGTTVIDDVTVHRLPVSNPRDNRLFGPLNARVVAGYRPVPYHLQREWMRFQGPHAPSVRPWIADHAGRFDVAIICTYLYFTTFAALPVASDLLPTLMHPTAHDEPPLYLPLFDFLFRLPHAFGFLTEEEASLVRRRFRIHRPSSVIGIGVDLEAAGVGASFRSKHGIGSSPYLVYVGRIDPHKGAEELVAFFAEYKRRHSDDLRLVMVGDPVWPVPQHPDVIVTGFVDEQTKRDAIDGAIGLIHPSYFESFSMVLTEAWAQRRPVLVQGRCDVLAGQVRRSGGGLPYVGFAEFECALETVQAEPALASAMAAAGRRYVERRYSWDAVLDRYEMLLERTCISASALGASRCKPSSLASRTP